MTLSKVERSTRAKYALNKGKRYERKIAHMICDTLGFEYEFNPRMDRSGAGNRSDRKGDIDKSEALTEVFPFHIECKNQENWGLETFFKNSKPPAIITDWIDQATEDSQGNPWIIVFSKRYISDLAILSWDIRMNLSYIDKSIKEYKILNDIDILEKNEQVFHSELFFFYRNNSYSIVSFSEVLKTIKSTISLNDEWKDFWKKMCQRMKDRNYSNKEDEDGRQS